MSDENERPEEIAAAEDTPSETPEAAPAEPVTEGEKAGLPAEEDRVGGEVTGSAEEDAPYAEEESPAEEDAPSEGESPAEEDASEEESSAEEDAPSEEGESSAEVDAPSEEGESSAEEDAPSEEGERSAEDENSAAPAAPSRVKKVLKTVGFYLLRVLCVLLLTVVVAVGALYGVIRIMVDGPSDTARELFVMSVRETSAIGFLADMFLTQDEIAEIYANQEVLEYPKTDTSLVNIEPADPGAGADAWGLVDDDGDGIVLDEVKGEGYSGYMLVVYDPSRVIMGCVPSSLGSRGYTVEGFVKHFDAVAGINGGGFADENGQGDGSIPDKAIVFDGQMYYGGYGTGSGFVGLDYDHKLHVGLTSHKAIQEANIQYGCSFGPVLVSNGVGTDPDKLDSGINPRTAIGQRSDGAILMLVIDGRQVISLGATYADLTDIMLRYGAVNACNLDGGSSSLMYYNGAYVNNCASVIGIRDIPTSFVVLKEGASVND